MPPSASLRLLRTSNTCSQMYAPEWYLECASVTHHLASIFSTHAALFSMHLVVAWQISICLCSGTASDCIPCLSRVCCRVQEAARQLRASLRRDAGKALRFWGSLALLLGYGAQHYTLAHPFLLADNRRGAARMPSAQAVPAAPARSPSAQKWQMCCPCSVLPLSFQW